MWGFFSQINDKLKSWFSLRINVLISPGKRIKREITIEKKSSKGVSAGYETFVIVYPTLTFI